MAKRLQCKDCKDYFSWTSRSGIYCSSCDMKRTREKIKQLDRKLDDERFHERVKQGAYTVTFWSIMVYLLLLATGA